METNGILIRVALCHKTCSESIHCGPLAKEVEAVVNTVALSTESKGKDVSVGIVS